MFPHNFIIFAVAAALVKESEAKFIFGAELLYYLLLTSVYISYIQHIQLESKQHSGHS